MALTATATAEVIGDVINLLQMSPVHPRDAGKLGLGPGAGSIAMAAQHGGSRQQPSAVALVRVAPQSTVLAIGTSSAQHQVPPPPPRLAAMGRGVRSGPAAVADTSDGSDKLRSVLARFFPPDGHSRNRVHDGITRVFRQSFNRTNLRYDVIVKAGSDKAAKTQLIELLK